LELGTWNCFCRLKAGLKTFLAAFWFAENDRSPAKTGERFYPNCIAAAFAIKLKQNV